MRKSAWLGIPLLLLALSLLPASARAQSDQAAPKVALVVSFQQTNIRINDRVNATIFLANESDTAITNVSLSLSKPDFLIAHSLTCDGPILDGSLDLGVLSPHTTLSAPVSLCFNLDRNRAVTGSYNILFTALYRWGDHSDLVTSETSLSVDLIGMETILGIPVGLAGFVLPGFMLLVALGWFKVPWVENLNQDTTKRIVYSVILSLILMGPFSWLAGRPGTPEWLAWLDFQQQISIVRLGIYTVVGSLIGGAIGAVYRLNEKRKADRWKWLKIIPEDSELVKLKKGLALNKNCPSQRVYFENKENGKKIYAYHYALYDKSIYAYGQFQLIAGRLSSSVQEKIQKMVGGLPAVPPDARSIRSILNLLREEDKEALLLLNPVVGLPGNFQKSFQILEADKYHPAQFDDQKPSFLLEILAEPA